MWIGISVYLASYVLISMFILLLVILYNSSAMDFSTVLLIFILILATIWYLIKRHYEFWHRMGIAYVPPIFPYGNLKETSKLHFSESAKKIYDKYKHSSSYGHRNPFIGMYFFLSKVILITDLDLLKQIMVKDFQQFAERKFYYNEKDDPLSAHLFSIGGPKWKILRAKMTPTFTSGKMKYMFQAVTEVGDRLKNRLNEVISTNTTEIEIKDYWARFSTDVIGSCAFGIECNTINNNNAEFREMGRIVFEQPRRTPASQMILNNLIWLGNLLRIKHLPDRPATFFMDIVKETVKMRESITDINELRKDFMTLMIEMKNNPAIGITPLTVEEVAAQAFVFYIAGFETSSTLLSFCSFELAVHQNIQQKARKEIIDTLARHNGQFTYDALLELTYLDQVLYEALRKYPPIPTITRSVNNDYPIGSKLYLPKGAMVVIPVYAIHHDPEFYPDPEKFDPDRFSASECAKRNSFSFLPFGEGPRNCIGLRFGMMQARVAMAKVLLNFKFSLSSKMELPLEFANKHMFLSSKNGIWLKMESITE